MGGKGTVISQTSGQDGKLRLVEKPTEWTEKVGEIVSFKLKSGSTEQHVGFLYEVNLAADGSYEISGKGTQATVWVDSNGKVVKFSGTTTLEGYPEIRLEIKKADATTLDVGSTPSYSAGDWTIVDKDQKCSIIYDHLSVAIGVDFVGATATDPGSKC